MPSLFWIDPFLEARAEIKKWQGFNIKQTKTNIRQKVGMYVLSKTIRAHVCKTATHRWDLRKTIILKNLALSTAVRAAEDRQLQFYVVVINLSHL